MGQFSPGGGDMDVNMHQHPQFDDAGKLVEPVYPWWAPAISLIGVAIGLVMVWAGAL